MKRLLFAILILFFLCGNAWALTDVDSDDNNALDIANGGTNATSAAAAKTALGITDDQTAAEVSNTPAGNISANNVQDAIDELDDEKESATSNDIDPDRLAGDTSDDDKIAADLIEYYPVALGVACSDESTDLTTGTAKVTFRMPYAVTLTAVRANVNTAPVGSTIIVDINEAGSTILSTKLTIDASEETSTTAATAAVISDSALADDAEITIDIDQIGSGTAGTGLKIWLIGTRTL